MFWWVVWSEMEQIAIPYGLSALKMESFTAIKEKPVAVIRASLNSGSRGRGNPMTVVPLRRRSGASGFLPILRRKDTNALVHTYPPPCHSPGSKQVARIDAASPVPSPAPGRIIPGVAPQTQSNFAKRRKTSKLSATVHDFLEQSCTVAESLR